MAAGTYKWQNACTSEEHKRVFPAAENNKGPILEVLSRLLPSDGTILEVASGTGQHIAHFAAALPGSLLWQPSDLTDELFLSIKAHCNAFSNVKDPVVLDASAAKWPVQGPLTAVIVANLTHIAPWEATLGLISGSSRLLRPGGLLCIYGPFKLDGQFTTQSNQDFHSNLVSSNPSW
jgi:SAM-dependent methyltransferase